MSTSLSPRVSVFPKRNFPPPPPRGLRVAVVVPQEAFAETLAASLQEGRHEVMILPSADDALADARVPQADVVILGVDPLDARGFAVAKLIRDQSAWRKPFVVAIALHHDPALQYQARELGVHLFLEKPVDLDRLRGVLVRFHHLLADVEGFDPMI
jgi:DNA-binding response OmpR family regulator